MPGGLDMKDGKIIDMVINIFFLIVIHNSALWAEDFCAGGMRMGLGTDARSLWVTRWHNSGSFLPRSKAFYSRNPGATGRKSFSLPVTAVGQSISVINHFPTIFNRCRRANCGSPAPAERENLAFLVEFYFSLLESLWNDSKWMCLSWDKVYSCLAAGAHWGLRFVATSKGLGSLQNHCPMPEGWSCLCCCLLCVLAGEQRFPWQESKQVTWQNTFLNKSWMRARETWHSKAIVFIRSHWCYSL